LAATENSPLKAQAAAAPVALQTPAGRSDAPPSRALLDQYCVTCHNTRLKTAGLMLDQLDLADVKGNTDILEKVVRKLRSGQMPPRGPASSRPDHG
jgi:cytochrome c5